jgi:hypothetical protein
VGRAIPIRRPQGVTDLPVRGQRQPPGGHCRARDIPAQPLDPVALMSGGLHPGV